MLIIHVAVHCGSLKNTATRLVDTSSGTTFMNIATYTCVGGYMLNGEATRKCQSTGLWSEAAPVCKCKIVLLLIVYIHINLFSPCSDPSEHGCYI